MLILIDIVVALCLIGYILVEGVRINVFKMDKNALLAGFTSVLAIAFGLYLIVKNGLILDYGTEREISVNWAGPIWFLGVVSVWMGLGFILSSIVKFLLWKFKGKGS